MRKVALGAQPATAGSDQRQPFWEGLYQRRASPLFDWRRSRVRDDDQQLGGKHVRDDHQLRGKHVREGALVNSSTFQHQQVRSAQLALDKPGNAKQPFVSFYFTNVPENISYISLRRGFEVCGILEDVYLAKKRNVNGGVFGFVRYGNVKDFDKLLKALNNVWFGDWRVVAKVASFDRLGNKNHGEGVKGESDNKKVLDVGGEGVKNHVRRGKYTEVDNVTVRESDVGAEAVGRAEVVLKAVEGIHLKEGAAVYTQVGRQVQRGENGITQVYIPKYTSSVSDMSWAAKGVVVSVLSGDAIPVLQRRIFDAGFVNLAIIPMGADKVFLRSLDDVDVSITLSEAANFFNNFFSKPLRWNKDKLVHERGAWVRIYGVPLHAWNYDFFKLCVYDCGRLLRLDDITLDRDRFDYARILVATNSLDVIKQEASIVVDGVPLEFKIIEEWGYSVGEDLCLVDDEASQADDRFEMPEDFDTGFGGRDVDELVNTLSAAWKKEDEAHHLKPSSPVSASVKEPSHSSFASPVSVHVEAPLLVSEAKSTPAQVCDNVCKADHMSRKFLIDDNKVVKRTSSCPPGRVRATTSGPWSLDWVQRAKSLSTGGASKSKNGGAKKSAGVQRAAKKKGGGYLRHGAQSLKRIARLSESDRREVLRALRRTTKHRRAVSGASKPKASSKAASPNCTSQTSVNNDWNNWLMLHGNDKVRSEDVCDIGRAVGLNFTRDKNNMFDVLSGVGRNNREGDGDGV